MADPNRHLDLVRLNEIERAALFERLGDRPGAVPLHQNRRAHPRWEYRCSDVAVTVVHPGGGESYFRVLARNISASGIAFIHGGYIHPTANCRFILRGPGGQVEQITGRVVGCRHIEGMLHEVRAQFERVIEPEHFLRPEDHADGSDDAASAPDLTLTLLYLETSDVDANLMEHYVANSGITLRRVTTTDEAATALEAGDIDCLLLELTLAGEDGAAAITAAREKGFKGPIVAVTAETNEERLGAATAAGAVEILTKPFAAPDLLALLQRVTNDANDFPNDEVLYSTLDSNEGITRMLMQFIDHAAKLGRELQEALDQQNLEQARAACMNIKGSAAGHGYEPLSAAAAEALQLIDQTMSLDDCAERIGDLSRMCRKLAMREAAGGAPEGDPNNNATGESDAA